MNWINKLERKFGKFAIPNLIFYIILLYAVGFIINKTNPGFYDSYLSLNAEAILRGEVWRIFTFLINPPSDSFIFILIVLYLYYSIGQTLEEYWGSFRFNLYFFSGVIFHVLAALLTYAITGISFSLGTAYLNYSLFFAFAALFPNVEFLLFFILPVKVKYLAYIDGAFFGWTILQGLIPSYGGNTLYGPIYQANAIAAFVSLLNFLLFFLSMRKNSPYNPRQIRRKHKFRMKMNEARREKEASLYPNGAKHRCTVCGRTELDNPNLEFRFCTKCSGAHEYCQDHLFTHEHIK